MPRIPAEPVFGLSRKKRVPKFPMSSVWWAMQDCLLGGAGMGTQVYTISSVFNEYDLCIGRNRFGQPVTITKTMPLRIDQMQNKVPHSMMAQPCGNTFTYLDDFAIQLSNHADKAYFEQKRAIELFEVGKHSIAIFDFNKQFIIVAVKFGEYKKLNVHQGEEMHIRFESYDKVTVDFVVPHGAGQGSYRLDGFSFQCHLTISYLPTCMSS